MKNWMLKTLSYVLAATMVLESFSMPVYATQADNRVYEEQLQLEGTGSEEQDLDSNIWEGVSDNNIQSVDEDIDELEGKKAEEAEDVSGNNIANQDETFDEDNSDENQKSIEHSEMLQAILLQYLYVQNPKLVTPSEQTILVGVQNINEEIQLSDVVQNAELVIENYRTKESIRVSADYDENNLEDGFVFKIPFTEDMTGTYQITEVVLKYEQSECRIALDEIGILSYFGVNEDVQLDETDENARPDYYLLDEENVTSEELAQVESNIVVFEGEEQTSVSSIEEALLAAKAGVTGGGLLRAGATSTGKDVVVVLDPGHDDTHKGAAGNGLSEEALTFKIANYCKAALEEYSGVTVYMTRTSTACPYPGTTSVVCNSNRVAAAKKVGADIYVSIHLNANNTASVNGAEVYYPNSNYNATIGNQGKLLAQKIQDCLVALGIYNRGIKIFNSQDGSMYPDGSLADYYGVIKNSKLNGFPAIIVEHAFISNANDAYLFLDSNDKLKKLGVADAEGIANYLGLSKGGKVSFSSDDLLISEVDTINGTFAVNLNNVKPYNNVQKVQFKVWTKADKSDVKIYNAKDLGDGNFKATVYASKHKNAEGTYQIEAYITDQTDEQGKIDSTSYNLVPSFKGKISTSIIGTNNTHFQLKATGIEGAASVRFLFYFKKDGKEKGKYYKAKKDSSGNWYYNLKLKEMVNEGSYKVYVYATGVYGTEKQAGTKAVTFKRDMSVTVKATSSTQKKFRITASGLSYASKVEYEVYSKTGGKDDLKTYKAKKNSEGAWTYDVKIANHKTEGTYYATVYATIGGKKITVGKKKFKVSGPTAAKTSISENSVKANMTVGISNVSSVSGIKEVKLKVWTNKKEDAKWVKAKKAKNGTYKATIKYSSFGYYYGKYNVEVYATDNNKISKMVKKTSKKISVPEVTSTITCNEAKTKYTVTVPDISYASKMEIKVWSKKGGSSNKKVFAGKKNSSGKYIHNIDMKKFSNEGKYYVYAYATIGSKKYLVSKASYMVVDIEEESGYYTIMGSSSVTATQLVAYYNANAHYPSFYDDSDAKTIKKFCEMYIEECNAENVKAEVAFVQAMKETNFLKYGGDVSISQYNFAGLGATGNGVKGNSFSTVRLGIRAQVQHLKAYACEDALVNEQVDPRFQYVRRGTCQYVEWLGINENPLGVGWATDPGYGNDIVERIKTLKSY